MINRTMKDGEKLSKDEYIERLESQRDKYNELIMAVATNHPNETRHETALRYIFEAEKGSIEAMEDALLPGGNDGRME